MYLLLDQQQKERAEELVRMAHENTEYAGDKKLYVPELADMRLVRMTGATVKSYGRLDDIWTLELQLGECIFTHSQPLPFLGEINGH